MAGFDPVGSSPVGSLGGSGGTAPTVSYPDGFNRDFPNPQIKRRVITDRGYFVGTPLAHFAAAMPTLKVTKFLAYFVDGDSRAFQASKFLAYFVDGDSRTLQATKFIAYIVYEPAPLNRFEPNWPDPIRPRRLRPQGDVWPSFPDRIPVGAAPFQADPWANPTRPRRSAALGYIYVTPACLLATPTTVYPVTFVIT